MKAISLLQPWATLVVMGAKKIETRSWNTKYRGELLIHASVSKKSIGREIATIANQFGIKKPAFDDLPFGAIIGKVTITETGLIQHLLRMTIVYPKELSKQEYAFGDYSEGRYAWHLADAVQFAQPIPAKGSLGLWNYDLPEHFHVPNKYGGHYPI